MKPTPPPLPSPPADRRCMSARQAAPFTAYNSLGLRCVPGPHLLPFQALWGRAYAATPATGCVASDRRVAAARGDCDTLLPPPESRQLRAWARGVRPRTSHLPERPVRGRLHLDRSRSRARCGHAGPRARAPTAGRKGRLVLRLLRGERRVCGSRARGLAPGLHLQRRHRSPGPHSAAPQRRGQRAGARGCGACLHSPQPALRASRDPRLRAPPFIETETVAVPLTLALRPRFLAPPLPCPFPLPLARLTRCAPS